MLTPEERRDIEDAARSLAIGGEIRLSDNLRALLSRHEEPAPSHGVKSWPAEFTFPPYTHGRVVCRACGAVVAQCRCMKGCEVVASVPSCKQCPSVPVEPAPRFKVGDRVRVVRSDSQYVEVGLVATVLGVGRPGADYQARIGPINEHATSWTWARYSDLEPAPDTPAQEKP